MKKFNTRFPEFVSISTTVSSYSAKATGIMATSEIPIIIRGNLATFDGKIALIKMGSTYQLLTKFLLNRLWILMKKYVYIWYQFGEKVVHF